MAYINLWSWHLKMTYRNKKVTWSCGHNVKNACPDIHWSECNWLQSCVQENSTWNRKWWKCGALNNMWYSRSNINYYFKIKVSYCLNHFSNGKYDANYKLTQSINMYMYKKYNLIQLKNICSLKVNIVQYTIQRNLTHFLCILNA